MSLWMLGPRGRTARRLLSRQTTLVPNEGHFNDSAAASEKGFSLSDMVQVGFYGNPDLNPNAVLIGAKRSRTRRFHRERCPGRSACEFCEDAAAPVQTQERGPLPALPREVSALPGFSLASQGISLAIQCQSQ